MVRSSAAAPGRCTCGNRSGQESPGASLPLPVAIVGKAAIVCPPVAVAAAVIVIEDRSSSSNGISDIWTSSSLGVGNRGGSEGAGITGQE